MTTATRALLLDGSHAGDPTGPRAAGALDAALAARGHHPETITLRDKRIGNCAGDFGCWIKHPGICMTDDDNREIAAAIVNADLVAYLGPVTFGGPSAPLKRLVDHQIQNIAPNFITIDGETHHRKRYARYPSLLSVGWQSEPNAAEAAIFSTLAARNAINFHADASVAAVVPTALTDDEFRAAADGWLAALARGERLAARPLPAVEPEAGAAPKRALLLVGSPRTRTSTSNALGDHLFGRLAAAGVATETINLHPAARSTTRMAALLDAVEAADLVVLAFPLYVDSLPAPVIEVLERVVADRRGRPARREGRRFAAIANCGFPESRHNAAALAICAQFARQAGFGWAGGLSLGGGEGLIGGKAPAAAGGRARNVVAALDQAGDALAAGAPIPQAAIDLLAQPAIPPFLYRAVGALGWRLQARKAGVAFSLGRRPYAP